MLRAENETRTRDPNLGKVVLYQLSYFRNTKSLSPWDTSDKDVFHRLQVKRRRLELPRAEPTTPSK